jgi:hypothetical protein
MQHGVVDYHALVPMLQAISTTPTVPIVRVPWLEPGILMKALDAGAYASSARWSTAASTRRTSSPGPTTRRAACAASGRCGRRSMPATTTRSTPTTRSSRSR